MKKHNIQEGFNENTDAINIAVATAASAAAAVSKNEIRFTKLEDAVITMNHNSTQTKENIEKLFDKIDGMNQRLTCVESELKTSKWFIPIIISVVVIGVNVIMFALK